MIEERFKYVFGEMWWHIRETIATNGKDLNLDELEELALRADDVMRKLGMLTQENFDSNTG